MAISHAGHNHPATPAGRKACRALHQVATDFNPALAQSSDYIADHIRKTAANGAMKARMDRDIKMTGPVARRIARQAVRADNVRIQPKRSGARVSARNASCIQAALHIDAHGGMCACGWVAA